MKANQKSLLANDTRAQVGIGTMIVFIATILVAATAAAVLIDTSGKLQERSSSTGTEATSQVASNLVLKQVVGTSHATDIELIEAKITVALAPGASSVDLEQMRIRVTDGSALKTYSWTGAETNMAQFTVTFLRGTSPVMQKGDLVNIELDFDDADGDKLDHVDPRTSVTVLLVPEIGSQLDTSFRTPESWDGGAHVVLR